MLAPPFGAVVPGVPTFGGTSVTFGRTDPDGVWTVVAVGAGIAVPASGATSVGARRVRGIVGPVGSVPGTAPCVCAATPAEAESVACAGSVPLLR
jgi:hypothetical protein